MNTLWFLFSSSFIIGLSGAMMPGPVLTATIGEVLKRGFIAGPLIVLGHGILEVGLLLLLVAGLGDWLVLPAARMWLGYVGGGLLLVMGSQMVITSRTAAETAAASTRGDVPAPIHGPVIAGAVTTLSNPYFYVWWATIGLGYASISLDRGAAGLTAFYSGHILADLAWYSIVAAGLATGRKWCPPLAYRIILSGCGVALFALGVMFICYGFQQTS